MCGQWGHWVVEMCLTVSLGFDPMVIAQAPLTGSKALWASGWSFTHHYALYPEQCPRQK